MQGVHLGLAAGSSQAAAGQLHQTALYSALEPVAASAGLACSGSAAVYELDPVAASSQRASLVHVPAAAAAATATAGAAAVIAAAVTVAAVAAVE